MNDLDVNADWNLLYGDSALFAVTRKLRTTIQREDVELTAEDMDAYLSVNRAFALHSPIVHNLVVVHDPQPLPMIRFRRRENPWVWRCHIDPSTPKERVIELLNPFVLRYDATGVSSKAFHHPRWPMDTHVMPPAIDPFAKVNRELSQEEVDAKLAEYGIACDKSLIGQVSRLDKWKDPLGVLEIFRRVKQDADCRLVLLGNLATDDPEGPEIFLQGSEQAGTAEDVALITRNDLQLVNAHSGMRPSYCRCPSGMGQVAIDGTKIKASASKHRAMSYARMEKEEKRLREEIARSFEAVEATDHGEDENYGVKRGDELPEHLKPEAQRLKERPREVLADAGYFSDDNVTTLQERKIAVLIPPERVRHQERRECSLPSAPPSEGASVAEWMSYRLKLPENQQRYRKRDQSVEPVFGQIKEARGLRQFLLRGLRRVAAMRQVGVRSTQPVEALPLPGAATQRSRLRNRQWAETACS